jgi:hypothetical protein
MLTCREVVGARRGCGERRGREMPMDLSDGPSPVGRCRTNPKITHRAGTIPDQTWNEEEDEARALHDIILWPFLGFAAYIPNNVYIHMHCRTTLSSPGSKGGTTACGRHKWPPRRCGMKSRINNAQKEKLCKRAPCASACALHEVVPCAAQAMYYCSHLL